MNPIVKYGVVLGILVVAWTFVLGITGWYRHPVLLSIFLFVVIPIEIGVLYAALRRTAAQGKGYGGQVLTGTLVALVAAPIIFVGSVLATSVVFPDYFPSVLAAHESALRSRGFSEDVIRQQIDEATATQTPMIHALTGAIGTVVTGLVGAAVMGTWVRGK